MHEREQRACCTGAGLSMERIFRRGHHGGNEATARGESATPPSKFKPDPRAMSDDNAAAIIIPCTKCKEPLYVKELENNLHVCPKCGMHFALTARQRVAYTLDTDSFVEWDTTVRPTDPLGFAAGNERYQDKLTAAQAKTDETETMITGRGLIHGAPVAIAIADFAFIGASMGGVYGEKLTRAAERAVAVGLPLVTFNTSGGARMQEGLFSLMQMAKTTAAVAKLGAVGLPHISILADPCYGGVTASYATVADVILAETGARIGFAGKRMIEQIMKQRLGDDVQTAEFQLKHGMVDAVIHRRDIRQTLATLLALYSAPRSATDATATEGGVREPIPAAPVLVTTTA